jgi:hypothetical protein
MKKIKKQLVLYRNWFICKCFDYSARLSSIRLPIDETAIFIVSIASYPKRDPLLPAVFQALSKQTVLPQKWILVLSVQDYEKGLPKHLQKLEKRGVEILWVKDNPYAVKKLIPVIQKYPQMGVVTLDDDIIYHPSLLSGLVKEVNKKDGIVGYIGKSMLQKQGKLDMYYRETKPASQSTDPNQVYLIGWGGIYYPPKSLNKRVLQMDAVHKIVPGRGSDIWFWAAAHATGTKQFCLGIPKDFNLGIPIPQNQDTQPKDQPGNDVLLERFQMAIDYFGIRERLLEVLPEKNL